MKLPDSGLIPIQPSRWVQQFKQGGCVVLKLSISLPRLVGDGLGVRRINRYYSRLADRWRDRWTGPLLCRAKEAHRLAQGENRPFFPWEVQADYTVTLQTPERLSLYWEAYEFTGGAHGDTVRHGDTWELPWGAPMPLRCFLPPKRRRAFVLAQVAQQIQAQVDAGEGLYFPQWPALIKSQFDPDRFYLTPEGLAVFYPLYAIAPYAEGIPTFPLSLPTEPAAPEKAPIINH